MRTPSLRRARRTPALAALTITALMAASLTLTVAPASAAATTVASDDMGRSATSGWGSAPTGGTWTTSATAVTSVAGGRGLLQGPAAGKTALVSLDGVSVADVATGFDLVLPQLPASGSDLYFAQHVRKTAAGSYAVRVRVKAGGATTLSVVRNRGWSAQELAAERISDIQPGQPLKVSFSVQNADGRVALKAKAWTASAAEPAEWTVSADDTASDRLTAAGALMFSSYDSGQPTPVTVDNFTAQTTTVDPPATSPAPTQPPVQVPDSAPVQAPTQTAPQPSVGAAAPGTATYAVPAGAIIASPTGRANGAGTAQDPVNSITAAIKLVGNGGTIALRGGTYHEGVIIPPEKRITLQPYGSEAVWMDGAEPVAGWRQSGAQWIKDGWNLALDSSPTYTKGAPDGKSPNWSFVNPAYPMAAHPDQLWVDGVALQEVSSRGAVTSTSFYVDDAADQLVTGANVAGKRVEASTLTSALSIRADGTTVKGIGIRRYAPSVWMMGAVTIGWKNVTLQNVMVRDNSTTGVYTWATGTTFDRVSLIGNGLMGAGATKADGLKVDRMLSQGNDSERFNRAPASGALKITSSRGVSVTNSSFIDNLGQGPWFDESVYDITFTGNTSTGNTGHGLVLELSEKAIVADNVIAKNALNGILIANTGNVAVWNNTVVSNARNINVVQGTRRASNASTPGHDKRFPASDTTVPWITRNNVISNNVMSAPAGNCLVCVEDHPHWVGAGSMISQSNGNLYQRPSGWAPTWFGIWARANDNPATSNTLAAFTAATGQDKRSKLIEGSSVVDGVYRLTASSQAAQSSVALPIPAAVAAVSKLTAGATVLGAQR